MSSIFSFLTHFHSLKRWQIALIVFITALLAYGLTAHRFGGSGTTNYAYFDRLAYSFLQGNLSIDSPVKQDLTYYNGRWYVPFPPLPAILLLPWVALTGQEQVNAIAFSLLLGAANVMLTYLVLAAASTQGYSQLKQSSNLWLTVFFALGTMHWTMTLQGTVWFLAQIATYMFVALAVYLVLQNQHPLLVGLMLGLAMLGRPHVAFTGLLLLAIVWQKKKRLSNLLYHAVLIGLPMFIAVALLLVYNQARFDNWRDFGYQQQNIVSELADDLETYGQFNIHFIPRNARAMLWATPQYDESLAGWWPDKWGMSLFLTIPPLVYLFGLWPRHEVIWLMIGAWLTIALTLVPLLTYYNTGWWQFGYRFALDFMMPLWLLLAISWRQENLPKLFMALILLSIVINYRGAYWFALITGRI